MKILCIGHSHSSAVSFAYMQDEFKISDECFEFILLNNEKYGLLSHDYSEDILPDAMITEIEESITRLGGLDVVFLWVGGGNQHTISLLNDKVPFDIIYPGREHLPINQDAFLIPFEQMKDFMKIFSSWKLSFLRSLAKYFNVPMFQWEPPPPVESSEHIMAYPGPAYQNLIHERGVSPPSFRQKICALHSKIYEETCNDIGITYLHAPDETTSNGFLKIEYMENDSIHANIQYGKVLLREIRNIVKRTLSSKIGHPYKHLPASSYWSKSVANEPFPTIDPVVSTKFDITPSDKVATAGSCFAQHIARHLQAAGFNYFVAESAHPIMPPDLQKIFGYGVFSARYANLYTTRQLLQLLRRAYGQFMPSEDVWEDKHGRFFDPFRPTINPNGFASLSEYRADREKHFSAVRNMFAELDIFVFTLGLTECWVSAEDGAAYPVCPGTAAGVFDPKRYVFVNFTVQDIVNDMEDFISALSLINPRARILLTVSPVPLVATAEQRHVLVSTIASKSILRAAADEIARKHCHVDYFPSYEIIVGHYNHGRYFSDDLRTVTEEGVLHVMRIFMKHYTNVASDLGENGISVQEYKNEKINIKIDSGNYFREMKAAVDTMCDEEILNATVDL